jgi:hypothetical protein
MIGFAACTLHKSNRAPTARDMKARGDGLRFASRLPWLSYFRAFGAKAKELRIGGN